MTEDEAKTKWCPFVRLVISDIGEAKTDNRDFDYGDGTPSCIASECMAWRWKQEGIEHGEPIYNDTYGHCGLASK